MVLMKDKLAHSAESSSEKIERSDGVDLAAEKRRQQGKRVQCGQALSIFPRRDLGAVLVVEKA